MDEQAISISVPTHGFPNHCYLLKGNDSKYLLIDCSEPKHIETIQTHIDSKPLEYLLITHAHHDHYGSASLIKENHPNMKIICHQIAAPLITLGESAPVQMSNCCLNCGLKIENAFGCHKMKKSQYGVKVDYTYPIDNDVEKRLMDNYGVKIMNTPGHTDCGISMYKECTKELFIGDLIAKKICGGTSKKKKEKEKEKEINYHFVVKNKKQVDECLKKFVELDCERIYASHFGGFFSSQMLNEQIFGNKIIKK